MIECNLAKDAASTMLRGRGAQHRAPTTRLVRMPAQPPHGISCDGHNPQIKEARSGAGPRGSNDPHYTAELLFANPSLAAADQRNANETANFQFLAAVDQFSSEAVYSASFRI